MNALCMLSGRERGGAAQAVIILLALVGLGVVFFITRKPATREKPPETAARTVEETASPSTPPPAAPAIPALAPALAPAPVPPTTPAPVVVAKPPPTPTPAPLDLATVAVSPALWPPNVALLQPLSFPILLNGRVVGQAKASAGTLLRLVRINGAHVEIEFQNARHSIPAAATDLLQRALMRLQSGDSTQTPGQKAVSAPMPAASPPATQAPATPTDADRVRLAQHIAVEPVAKMATQRAGGFYDKRDEFELKLKFKNSDTRTSAENLKAEVYIVGESLQDPNVMRVLASEDFTFSVPARGAYEIKTKEVKTSYYNSGSYRSGVKFWSWFLRLRDSAGNVVKVKSSSPTLEKNADKVSGLKVETYYDKKTFKETTASP